VRVDDQAINYTDQGSCADHTPVAISVT
jgi:hypothetical protein